MHIILKNTSKFYFFIHYYYLFFLKQDLLNHIFNSKFIYIFIIKFLSKKIIFKNCIILLRILKKIINFLCNINSQNCLYLKQTSYNNNLLLCFFFKKYDIYLLEVIDYNIII